jgi:hypothetical protein
VAIAPRGSLFAYSGEGKTTHLVDLNNPKDATNIPTSGRMVFSTDGKMLCIIGSYGGAPTRIVYFEEPLPDPEVSDPIAARDENERLASNLLKKAKMAQRRKRRKQARLQLQKVVSEYPDTEAAKEARQILNRKQRM